MNMPRYAKIAFFAIILSIGIRYSWTQAQAVEPVSEQYGTPNVNSDNPFAAFLNNKNSTKQKVSQTLLVEEKPELFLDTVTLKFLDAKSLEKILANMSSAYGSVATNPKNNSLIICDTNDNLNKILSEIKKADKTPQQIMVEVVIVDVQLNDETEIGVNWDILSDKNYDIGYRQNFTTRLGSTIANSDNIGNATAFNTTGFGGNFSVISGAIRNVVALLQQKKDVEILASPRVMVVSGKTASIEAVKELPYNEITDTSEGGRLSSTQFKKVGVKLNVTATLTDDDLIFLTVDSEQNIVIGESATEVPIIDTRNAKSEVLLQDGQVVIIGGLRRKEITKQTDQVPILGDIPLVGLLFKYTDTVVNNTELIVLLSPHIYKGEPVPDDEMAKFKEIKERPMLSLTNDRDVKKQTLLKKIKILQNKKDKDVTKELLSTLTSLEKILSQEMQEALNEPETRLADEEM